MRDQDDGDTQLVDLNQEFHDLGVMAEILPGGGFIQDEDLRIQAPEWRRW